MRQGFNISLNVVSSTCRRLSSIELPLNRLSSVKQFIMSAQQHESQLIKLRNLTDVRRIHTHAQTTDTRGV